MEVDINFFIIHICIHTFVCSFTHLVAGNGKSMEEMISVGESFCDYHILKWD